MSKEVVREGSKKRKVSEKNLLKSSSKEAIVVYNKYFKHCDGNLESGIDLKTASANIKDLIAHYHWEKFVKPRETDINFTIVAEFYSVLSQFPTVDYVQTIELRKAKVPFTPEDINTFLGIPEVPFDQVYSVVWELEEKKKQFEKSREAQRFINPCATWKDGRFRIGGASTDAKVLKHLMSFNIVPHSHTSDINWSDACMIYAIITKQPVDLGMIIHREAYKFATTFVERGVIPYPGLIFDLCENAKVPSLPSDLIIPPASLKITSKDNKGKESRAGPNISVDGSSFGHPFPPQGSYFNDPALVARLDNMEASMREMRGGMQTLNDNISRGIEMNRQLNDIMFRGFDMARQWCEDLRCR